MENGRDVLIAAGLTWGLWPTWIEDGDPSIAENILARYAEPQRFYHTATHIQDMLITAHEWFEAPSIRGYWDIVSNAIVFHDIVYDPTRADNEEKSAVLAALMIPDGHDIEQIKTIILDTKSHKPTSDLSIIVCDSDMKILSSDSIVYDQYACGIRREYSHVPLPDYIEGRVGFLRKTLTGSDPIYDVTRQSRQWEQKARDNIAREIGYLTTQPAEWLLEK